MTEPTVKTPMGEQPHSKALGWYLPTMLRWIDDNRSAVQMPDGQLVGTVLRTAAERIEWLADERTKAMYNAADADLI
jgi:hypothetical protein